MSTASKLTGGYDANVSLFLAEVYEKEYKSRLNWFEKNYEKVFASRPPEHIPRKGKILYDEIVRRRKHDEKVNQRVGRKITMPALPRPDLSVEVLPDMRPVPPTELALLKEGSEVFLKTRYKTSPDQRYYFPATSNWNYGWLVEHLPVQSLASRIYAHKNIVKDTFLRRNGVHAECSHYRGTTSHNFDTPFL